MRCWKCTKEGYGGGDGGDVVILQVAGIEKKASNLQMKKNWKGRHRTFCAGIEG